MADSENIPATKVFRSLLSVLEEQGEEMITQRGYYLLLASRGMFARKIARRLKGVRFEGRETNACAVIEALQEVLRFAPFSEEVPNLLRKKMAFLDVSDSQLANRRIFETVVLITLADLIWLGRITSPDSRRFGNLWDCVVEAKGEKKKPEIANLVSKMRTDLKSEWDAFVKAPDLSSIVVQGRLATKRPPRKRLLEEEALLQKAKQRFLSGLRPISIVDVVAEVHRWTGMLDAIQIKGGRGRRLPDDQRTRLALAVITARGMNVGVPQMATLLGRWYTVGSLTNFDENYVTVESLERAKGMEKNKLIY